MVFVNRTRNGRKIIQRQREQLRRRSNRKFLPIDLYIKVDMISMVMKRKRDDLDRLTEKLLKQDPTLAEEFEKAGQAWDIAFQIINLREQAGLTQKELADLVGTKQSNIARLESADYTGYTLKTLEKVTRALKARLQIKIVPLGNKRDVYL